MVPSKCLVIGYSGRGQAGSRDGYPEQGGGEGWALALSFLGGGTGWKYSPREGAFLSWCYPRGSSLFMNITFGRSECVSVLCNSRLVLPTCFFLVHEYYLWEV